MKRTISVIALLCLFICIPTSCYTDNTGDQIIPLLVKPSADSNIIYSVSLEAGWNPVIRIVLYDDGLLQAYFPPMDGYYSLESCINMASETLKFSQILADDDYKEVVERFNNLPNVCSEPIRASDAWIVYFREYTEPVYFSLDSELNKEHSAFIMQLLSLAGIDLRNAWDYRTGDGLCEPTLTGQGTVLCLSGKSYNTGDGLREPF